MVGGFPIPEVNRLLNAFMAGARKVNPRVEFSVRCINSWFDPPRAALAAGIGTVRQHFTLAESLSSGVDETVPQRRTLTCSTC